MTLSGEEMLFIMKCLQWRLENPKERVISIDFFWFGVGGYLHNSKGMCKQVSAKKISELDEIFEFLNNHELESEEVCEVSEELKSAIS